MSNPAWESDPTTRHQYRWWDGEKWTEHVADDGVQSVDPLTGTESLKPPKGRVAPPARGPEGPPAPAQPVQLASNFARFGGRLIDVVIFWALITGVLFVLHFTDIRPMPLEDFNDTDVQEAYQQSVDEVMWAIFAFWAIYELALTAMKGQTFGKMATRTQVVRAGDHLQPGWYKSFIRLALPVVLLLPVLVLGLYGALLTAICYLSLTWNRNRQGWHDKAAGTLVVTKS